MTMQEQSEAEVWQNLFVRIIEDADSNILVLDDELRVLSLNPGFYWIFLETYGIDLRRGVSILQTMENVNPALAKLWKKRCQSALAGTSQKVEDEFVYDGKTYYWEIHFKASHLTDHVQVLSVFSRDITVRKAFQKKITEKEANLRSILNAFENSVWLINANYELIDFNKDFFKKYKQAFGIKLAKGKNILDLVPEDDPLLRKVWKGRYEAGLKGRPGKYIDSYVVGDVLRTFEIKTYPIVEESMVTGLTVFSRDITVYKEAEDQLKARNEELIKTNAELDRFVYSASHDLRAPLMSIKGLVNLIRKDQENISLDHYLQVIDKSIHRLDQFITDIVHHSRNSRLDVEAQPVEFQKVIDEVWESLSFMDETNEVQLQCQIQQLGPFYTDLSRLSIVFSNILSNALRYRDKRKKSFVRIELVSNDSQATIRFIDNGIGIASEYLDKVFRMFFRASNESKGSGLGLYIVKNTLEKINGSIDIASDFGEGTTFTVRLVNLQPT